MATPTEMSGNDYIDDSCNDRGWSHEDAKRIVELCEGNPYLLADIFSECRTFNEAIQWFNEPPSSDSKA